MAEPSAENNFGFSPEVRAAQHAAELDRHRYNLPADDEVWRDSYDRLVLLERGYFSLGLLTEDYEYGSADVPDEIYATGGSSSVLLTAEHATDHWRIDGEGKYKRRTADYGTGAVGIVVSDMTGARLLAAAGMQTGDANYETDPNHPFKIAMRNEMDGVHPLNVHMGIHGMGFNRVAAASDELPFAAILGIGDAEKASEATRHLAARITALATEYGLRVGTNAPIVHFQAGSGGIVRPTSSGSPETVTFAASHPGTTRAYAQQLAHEHGLRDFATLQIELSGLLRLMPWNYSKNPGHEAQVWGTYLGRVFVARCVEAAKEIH